MGVCKDGPQQSPIDIRLSNTVQLEKMRISMNYKSLTIPVANFDGKEIFITGNFGTLIHTLEVGQKKFKAKEIRFKFPSEHKIEGKNYDAEIVVYHKADNG